MALSESVLAGIRDLAASRASDPGLAELIRERLPEITVSRCDASDLGMEVPFLSLEGVDIHLVDGSGHCWSITGEPELATGVLLARRRRR